MTAVYHVLFLAGLVLAVFAMLYGTERRVTPALAPHERRSEHDTAAEPSALFNRASLAAFIMGVGLTGTVALRYTTWHGGVVFVLGASARDDLFHALLPDRQTRGLELKLIGDAMAPRRASDAIREGEIAAREI